MLYIIIAVLTVLVDQLTKYLYASVYNAPTVTLIDRVLGLEYVENKGAAWGIFADNQIALYIISAIMTVGMIVCFVIFYKRMSKLLRGPDAGKHLDIILAPNDGVAGGIREALAAGGYTAMPLLTGRTRRARRSMPSATGSRPSRSTRIRNSWLPRPSA